jgi:hypothetical protein
MLVNNVILISFNSDQTLTSLERQSLIDAIAAQVEDPHVLNDGDSMDIFVKAKYTTLSHKINFVGVSDDI